MTTGLVADARRAWQTLAVLAMCLCLSSLALHANSSPQPAVDVQAALKAMAASTRDARQTGLDTVARLVRTDEAVRSRRDVQLALAKMLVDESARLQALAARNEVEDDPYFEAYGSDLIPAAVAVLPQAGPKEEEILLKALLGTGFNVDSALAKTLALVGNPVAKLIVPLAAGPYPLERSKAYDLFGEMLAQQRAKTLRTPLTPESETAVRRGLLNGLRDRDSVCRRDAVRGVVKARLAVAIPILRELASTDPDDGRNAIPRLSVRGLAAKAVETLSNETPPSVR